MQRILVPIDFSPIMEGVLAQARQVARAFQAELHLVHVREIVAVPVFPLATIGYPVIGLPERGMSGSPAEFESVQPGTEGQKDQLETLRERLRQEGINTVVHQREGIVVEEILQAAGEISADLIVMGSHGHGSVYNLLVGSVTEGILKAARRPVLLVPAPAATK